MMTSKTHSYECCMCGDLGLSHELFRCKVCHFRSQHRYCSNLYPKAESYRVCNWCLIQKDDHLTTTTTTTTSNNSNTSSPEVKDHSNSKPTNKNKFSNNHQVGGPKPSKCLQPTSPIKKALRSPESRSPSGRKRITAGNGLAQAQAHQEEKLMMIRRTKSSNEILSVSGTSNNNRNSSGGGGGPAVIKHVFRNKVRRYKLLDEVSS